MEACPVLPVGFLRRYLEPPRAAQAEVRPVVPDCSPVARARPRTIQHLGRESLETTLTFREDVFEVDQRSKFESCMCFIILSCGIRFEWESIAGRKFPSPFFGSMMVNDIEITSGHAIC